MPNNKDFIRLETLVSSSIFEQKGCVLSHLPNINSTSEMKKDKKAFFRLREKRI